MLEHLVQTKGRKSSAQPLKYLPVVFIWSIIIGLYLVFVLLHCVPRMKDAETHAGGTTEFLVISVVTALLCVSYLSCILIHPGTIPSKEDDPTWEIVCQGNFDLGMSMLLSESKRTGDRRHCKWCAKYKPDRCHHCRICDMCILKMDHHCPWVYNCIGFRNHKYFFLLLLYTAISCHFIVWSMAPTVRAAADPSTPFLVMFLVLFGETLAGFIGVLVTLFLGFHIWLMLKALTTIEFCEKSTKRIGFDGSAYDRGVLGNIKAVLGDNWLCWLLPLSPPSGSGLIFLHEETPLLQKDAEAASHGISRTYMQAPPHLQPPTFLPTAPVPAPFAAVAAVPRATTILRRVSARPEASGGTGSAPGSADHSEEEVLVTTEDVALQTDPFLARSPNAGPSAFAAPPPNAELESSGTPWTSETNSGSRKSA